MALPARFAHLVGSKWTSTALLKGWRQFHVVGVERGASGWEVELAASVEPQTRARVPAGVLGGARFTPGWATAVEVRAMPAPAPTPEPVAKAP